MHAVIPHETENIQHSYILCHILEIKRNKEGEGVKGCEKDDKIDFYRLFGFLHNSALHLK